MGRLMTVDEEKRRQQGMPQLDVWVKGMDYHTHHRSSLELPVWTLVFGMVLTLAVWSRMGK